LGRIDKHRGRTTRYDAEHRQVDVLVIGGGRSGMRAAHAAAQHGQRVLLVDENPRGSQNDEGYEVLAPGRAIGMYEGGLVPVEAGAPQPAYSLLAQAGAKISYDAARGIFVPTELPDGVSAHGRVTGAVGELSRMRACYGDGGFVCICEDVGVKDLKRALAEGFDSIELAKRYTTVTMGPCQGRLCHLSSIRLYAKAQGIDEAAIGTTTARPPWAPVKLGLLAGRPHEAAKRTAL